MVSTDNTHIHNSRDQCKKQYGNQYLQKCELPSAWVWAYQYVKASDKSSRSAKAIKLMIIQPGQTINLPIITRTSTTYEPTDMMIEMTITSRVSITHQYLSQWGITPHLKDSQFQSQMWVKVKSPSKLTRYCLIWNQ